MDGKLTGFTFGRYVVEEKVGSGGFATVYRAIDTQLNRPIALKILHAHWSNNSSFVERFKQEAHFLANLQHPNIVIVHDAGEIEGFLYIAMNFIEGVTLKEKLETDGSFALKDAIPILRQLANALDYAHSKGILHRDLKPENVMLTKINGEEQAILMDFGLVKAIENSLVLTQDNSILGTPIYMAPERISSESANERNPASDRYSLGIITFYMLTGKLPFTGEPLQVMYAHQYHSIPNSTLTSAGLQKSTIDALLRMLAKRPEERFDTCIEFLKELEDAPARLTNYKSIRLKHIVGVLFAFVGIQTFLVFVIRQSDLFQPHGDENTPTSIANAIQDKETNTFLEIVQVENENECLPSGQINYKDWSLSYTVTSSDGLMVYDATFLDVPVFTSIKLVEWHEDYGTTGYLMTIGCHNEGVSGGFPIYPHNETVVQEMFADEQQETSIGVEVVQDFRMSNWGSTCNARYSQVYQFFEDGSFRVIGGAFGKGCGTNATYRPVFRVDMSIQGEGNDNFAYWNESEWVSVEIETYRSPYANFGNGPHSANEEGYSWYIYDVTGDGYYIEPNQNLSDSHRLDNPFIYVTLQHPNSEGDVDLEVIGNCCEDDFRQGPETFLNYETLVNQNLVLWYVPQRETVVEDENYQCWTLQAGEDPITYPCWSGLKFILSERFADLGS